MNFGKWMAVVFLWLGCGLAARAQFGAYFGYSGERLGGITCLSMLQTPAIPCSATSAAVAGSGPSTSSTDAVNPSGIYFGGYWDFKTLGPVRLGADVRYYDMRSNKSASSPQGGPNSTSANTILGGVRGTFHTHYSWLKPYGEIAFGRTSTNAADTPGPFLSYIRYQGFAGVDIKILPVLDIRPVELGLGDMSPIGNGSGSISVRSIGAALVFHTPPR
jgi:hypothetical protein